MKKSIDIWSLLVVMMVFMASCSKESDPVFEFTDPRDGFTPAEDATDEVSVLRREFYDETKTFLLFNDTLRHDFIGYDLNGDKRYSTELLDIKYEVGQSNTVTYKPTYSYLDTYEKCASAVAYLKAFILPHLSEKLLPFSWFLAGNIYDHNNYGNAISVYALSGQRSIALACAQLSRLKTDAQKQQLANRQLLIVVQNLANNNASAFSDFCSVSSSYYSANLNVPEGQTATEHVRELGFVNSTNATSYPSQKNDINAYATLVITYSDEKIENIYGNYPLIIKKAKMFRTSLEALGYIY